MRDENRIVGVEAQDDVHGACGNFDLQKRSAHSYAHVIESGLRQQFGIRRSKQTFDFWSSIVNLVQPQTQQFPKSLRRAKEE